MTIENALARAVKKLHAKKMLSPDLDAEVILAHVLKKDRAFLFSHLEQSVSQQKYAKFKKMIQRRIKHEPVAHITGHKYFYKLLIAISRKVLIPRPESELLVDLGLNYLKNDKRKKITVIDVGTGSGAIIIALAKNYKKAKYIGTDKYTSVLSTARKNARANKTKIEFIKSDLLNKFNASFWRRNPDILLVANLPYLPTRVWKNSMTEVRKFEPREALDGGPDGLRYYRDLVNDLAGIIKKLKSFQTYWEIHPGQEKELKKILKQIGAKKIKTHKDLCGRNRVIGWQK